MAAEKTSDAYKRLMRFFDTLVDIERVVENASVVYPVSFYEYPDNVDSQKEGILVNFAQGYVSEAVEHVPLSATARARFALGDIGINFKEHQQELGTPGKIMAHLLQEFPKLISARFPHMAVFSPHLLYQDPISRN